MAALAARLMSDNRTPTLADLQVSKIVSLQENFAVAILTQLH